MKLDASIAEIVSKLLVKSANDPKSVKDCEKAEEMLTASDYPIPKVWLQSPYRHRK